MRLVEGDNNAERLSESLQLTRGEIEVAVRDARADRLLASRLLFGAIGALIDALEHLRNTWLWNAASDPPCTCGHMRTTHVLAALDPSAGRCLADDCPCALFAPTAGAEETT